MPGLDARTRRLRAATAVNPAGLADPDYQTFETDFRVVSTMQSKTKKLLAALIAAGVVPAAHAADLKLGVAEALSGGAAQYGASIRNGFQLAADEINAAGGISGNKVVLVIEDEQGKKEEAINVFKKLIFRTTS